jgi:diacylglycerol kinase family enzyme
MSKLIHPPQRGVSSVVIVTSPKAGSGLGREQLPQLVEQLGAAGLSVCTTSSIELLRQRTQDIQLDQQELPVVIAAGGDGTLALVAENVPSAIPILPMPLGTENLLARHFGHSADPAKIVQTIRGGTSHWLDAGRANGKLFLVTASCGFDAEVVRAMHLTRRGHISRFSYAGPIFRALRRYAFPNIDVQVTNDQDPTGSEPVNIQCCWAMAFNLPCYGGHLSIEPGALDSDGLLDVITFRKGSILSGLRYLAGILLGNHTRFRDVTRVRGTKIEFTSQQRVPYQLDGDYGGHLPLAIELLPARVHLLVPSRQA